MPNIRETSLDDGLIEALVPHSAPQLLPSGTVVEMNIHNIGGLRRVYGWEIADIGVLVFIYRGDRLVAQKAGFLQSKRLYPENNDVVDEDPIGYAFGMNAFLRRQGSSPLNRLYRVYEFNDQCHYGAFDTEQHTRISQFNKRFGDSVYYLLYNPPQVPTILRYPLPALQSVVANSVGCRVHAEPDISNALAACAAGSPPTFSNIQNSQNNSAWRLEFWAADLLLRCKVGRQFDKDDEELIGQLLERRSGPIGAAIAVSIALAD